MILDNNNNNSNKANFDFLYIRWLIINPMIMS